MFNAMMKARIPFTFVPQERDAKIAELEKQLTESLKKIADCVCKNE